MSRMYNPPHPGEILKHDVLPNLGLTVTDAARQLRVTRVALSRILNGSAGISPDMALRLAAWLDTSPDVWLRMQVTYDLWRAEKKRRPRIVRARKAA
jgi:addiction module HigA family antidote